MTGFSGYLRPSEREMLSLSLQPADLLLPQACVDPRLQCWRLLSSPTERDEESMTLDCFWATPGIADP